MQYIRKPNPRMILPLPITGAKSFNRYLLLLTEIQQYFICTVLDTTQLLFVVLFFQT